jgi:hypothetical protein
MISENFSSPQVKAARIIVAREGWVVPARLEPLAGLVKRLGLVHEVNELADKLAACGDALKQLEADKRTLSRTLSAIRREAGRNTYGATVKALAMAEDALTAYPENAEISRLSNLLESKLLLNTF